MSYQALSLTEFTLTYSSEAACLNAIAQRRWPNGFVCPTCQKVGGSRMRTRRCYQCSACGAQTSITAGTVFHQAKLPLRKWFLAIYLIASNKQGISALSLSKHIDCSRVTAWHLLHKFRKAMQDRDLFYVLKGRVCVDEAYVGGEISSSHQSARSIEKKSPIIVAVEERGPNQTGFIHIEPSQYVDAEALHGVILEKVAAGSTIRTDGFRGYSGIGSKGYHHERELSLQRKAALSQFRLVHRAIGNFNAWLKGTFRNTCQKHLDAYAAEFCWRTNRRNMTKYDYAHNAREATLADRLITTAANSTWWSWADIRSSAWRTARC